MAILLDGCFGKWQVKFSMLGVGRGPAVGRPALRLGILHHRFLKQLSGRGMLCQRRLLEHRLVVGPVGIPLVRVCTSRRDTDLWLIRR